MASTETTVAIATMTLTLTPSEYRRIIQNEMAIKILKDLIEKSDYISTTEVKRIIDAVGEGDC